MTRFMKMKRRRVEVMCIECKSIFRYIYPGSGPYRSLCNGCVTPAYKKARR